MGLIWCVPAITSRRLMTPPPFARVDFAPTFHSRYIEFLEPRERPAVHIRQVESSARANDMSVRSIELLQRYLRRCCDEAAPSEDAVLLQRFTSANDREAFELLIARHGPMVLGTARRLVDNSHDVEDVFQAVFLSLARLAKSIRQGCTLPAWLHKATCRIAAKVRKNRIAVPKEPP